MIRAEEAWIQDDIETARSLLWRSSLHTRRLYWKVKPVVLNRSISFLQLLIKELNPGHFVHTLRSHIVQFMAPGGRGPVGTKPRSRGRKFDTLERSEQGERKIDLIGLPSPLWFTIPLSLLTPYNPRRTLTVLRWLCASISLIRQPAETYCSINCLPSRCL